MRQYRETIKALALAALVSATVLGTSQVQAGGYYYAPPSYYVAPPVVYAAPIVAAPVVVAPAPVVVHTPVVVAPPVYYSPAYVVPEPVYYAPSVPVYRSAHLGGPLRPLRVPSADTLRRSQVQGEVRSLGR